MFEMASVLREGEPVILEQSVVISKLFPKNINLIANSRENSFVVFAEKDKNKIYGFRYFTQGEKRVMQSGLLGNCLEIYNIFVCWMTHSLLL